MHSVSYLAYALHQADLVGSMLCGSVVAPASCRHAGWKPALQMKSYMRRT
ncbi:MAG: hypothetical protein IV108_09760 [Burkholderiales bacterium]|nr:hypothetical protein [Burkholderiales bacterium]